MYVKLNSYYASYLKIRYGIPLMFPKMSALNQCVESFLVNNPMSARLTDFCCTQIMIEGNENIVADGSDNCKRLPCKERILFVPVELPCELIRFGKTVLTGPTWQLSNSGTVLFRKLVKNEFWIAFSSFWNDCKFRAERMNEKASIECAVSDFAVQYEIDMKEFENILRYWQRIRISVANEIEARREALEEKTGRFLEYTT